MKYSRLSSIARNDQHLLALIGEDGVRDVTIAPRNDAAAVAIGSKSWPFDIRLRPWVFRPRTGLLPLRHIADGDVRSVATNGLESGRSQGFLLVLTGNMSDQVITVRCGIFFGRAAGTDPFNDLCPFWALIIRENRRVVLDFGQVD